jgi:ATP-dependent Clp protease ATP-binding subunit ClpB
MQLKIEREALKKENRRRLEGPAAALERSSPSSRSVGDADRALAGREGQARPGAPKIKEQLDQARIELAAAQRKGDFARGRAAYGGSRAGEAS